MRKTFVVLAAALLIGSMAVAELQNIEVGGSIRIRGNWYTGEVVGMSQLQNIANANPPGIVPVNWAWDDRVGNDLSFVEQRTRVNVKADFTDEVSAFIELDSYDIWGEEFRSAAWVTGADARAVTNNDVEVYQAYIEANEMFGMPLRLRIGRQELALGSQWLVGVNDTSSYFTGLSFDGILLTYTTDTLSVSAVWAKLAERSPIEQDGDVDVYGIYGSYLGIEDICIDAYWLMARDARRLAPQTVDPIWGPFGGGFNQWALNVLEDILGVDEWDPTYLHTVGLRGAGTIGALDFEAELAYQFGEADRIGNRLGNEVYGYPNDDVDFGCWGLNLEVGYTFDMSYAPRVYLGFVYLDGDDERDLDRVDTFGEWIVNNVIGWPFTEAGETVSFNRLFSNWEYSEFLAGTDLTNVWILRGGVSAMPTEDIEILLALSYFETVDEVDTAAWPGWIPWRTLELEDTLGWEVGLYVTYNYSEDLCFKAGYAHFFADEGLTGEDMWQTGGPLGGNFVIGNGTGRWMGPFGNLFWATVANALGLNVMPGKDSDDADYVFVETQIKF